MPLRDVALGQDDVIPLHATDGHFGLVELEALLLAAFFVHHDREHSLETPWENAN